MSLSMLIAIKLKQGRKTEQIVYKQYENVMQCYQFKIGEKKQSKQYIKKYKDVTVNVNCYQFKIGEENRAHSI